MKQIEHIQKWKRVLAADSTATDASDFKNFSTSARVNAKEQMFKRFGPLGILIGASLAASFLKYSRRNVFIFLNVVGIIACLISSIDNFYFMIFGRFLYGAVGGVMLSVTPKMLQETVPIDVYNLGLGASTNFVIEFYKVINMYGNKMLYSKFDNDVPKTPVDDFWQRWRIQFLLPIPFMVLALVIFATCARKETIEFYVKQNRKKEAIELMKQVIIGKEDVYYEKKYNEKKEQGVLYTNQIPSKRQQKKDAKALAKKEKKALKCISFLNKGLAKATGGKAEDNGEDPLNNKKKKKNKQKKKRNKKDDETDKGSDSDEHIDKLEKTPKVEDTDAKHHDDDNLLGDDEK